MCTMLLQQARGCTASATRYARCRESPRFHGSDVGAIESETEAAGLIEVAGLKAVGPVAFVVRAREVARAGTGDERVADRGRVPLVARAPGSGRNVHDIAPAVLVPDRRH